MKLSEKRNSQFTPHPETEGPIKAVIVDITELKERQTQYGLKEEFRLVFETECEDEANDRQFYVWSRGYTPSLNEKAALRKDLKKMMGRDLTQAELDEFDLESMIGYGVKLIIQHETKDDRTYANISFIAPDKDKALKPSGKYIRQRDREQVEGGAPAKESKNEPAAADWETTVVHVGKYKGKKLGEVDEAGVASLISKWLPQAKAAQNIEDKPLVAALTTLADIMSGDEY